MVRSSTAEDFFTYVKDGFDMLSSEGKTHPKMMSVGRSFTSPRTRDVRLWSF
jgi:hypothetical protein